MRRHTVVGNRNDGNVAVGCNGPDVFDLGVFEGDHPKGIAGP